MVASPRRDLLLTAAHCVSGSGRGYVFAPGYRDGVAPLGSWTVLAAYAAPGWLATQSTGRDFVFLVVAPERRHEHTEEIQSVTGANPIGVAAVSGERITVPAYEAGEGGSPISCDTRVYDFGAYRAFNCSPYVGGTSGAPWLHRSGRGWTVVGIIGGLHQGGCYPWTSYSPVFGKALLRTEARAANGGPPNTLPAPGPDGCG